ncbi:MAG: MATE family efflux transporter [Lachnospiraceae bacterium]|nr:MATE family efflux transporter [Lachnospiraceae bacterium]
MRETPKTQSKENRMATEPIAKLMAVTGLPIVLSMMLQAVYNIVDTAFLSNMRLNGEQALTALGLAFPIQLLMVAFGVGTGVGANALISKCLGRGDREQASRTVGNALTIGIIIYAAFLVFGLTCVPWYVNSQSSGGVISAEALNMSIEYLRICLTVSFGMIFFTITEKFLQATGRSLYSTIAQISGAVFNIAFDPLLIYGVGFFPEMGVRGAAVATVGGQILSCVLALIFHYRLDVEIDKSPKYMKLSWNTIKGIYAIGLPAIISQALLTVMTYGMNLILARIADVGENFVTVYGLYCKIQQLVLFAAFGLRDAITPIVSFCHGARDRQRVQDSIRYGLLYTLVLMVAGLVVVEAIAVPLMGLFSLSDTTYSICIDCIRIVSLGFVCAGLCISFQGIFQGIECGIQSLIVSAGRQVIFILPVAWAFVRVMNNGGADSLVWWTFLIGETLTLICSVIMYYATVKRKIDRLGTD